MSNSWFCYVGVVALIGVALAVLRVEPNLLWRFVVAIRSWCNGIGFCKIMTSKLLELQCRFLCSIAPRCREEHHFAQGSLKTCSRPRVNVSVVCCRQLQGFIHFNAASSKPIDVKMCENSFVSMNSCVRLTADP